MTHIWSDLRFAFRTLKSRPVFTAVTDQLVYLRDHQPCCNEASLSPGEYLDYQKQAKTFSGKACFSPSLGILGIALARSCRSGLCSTL